MSDFTFLTTGQIFGDNNTERLDIFKKLGSLSAITDFSILLGGYVNDDYHANRLNNLANRTGWWWTKTCDGDNDARVVVSHGYPTGNCPTDATVALAQLYRIH